VSRKKLSQIGRYKILGELGRGAMGVVYRAKDPALDRVVALKTILLADDVQGRKEYQRRFALEARAAGKLTHPNIVTVFDFGEQDDLAYIAMELLEGVDLRERLKDGPLAPAEAVGIAVQVAEGLAFAHERGVIHRDIKPGNIMLLERGDVKIMDFGIARMRSEDHKTSTGMILGTPRFMSPEQIAGEPVDQRSDLFSLGVVLHEMLTGAMLFAGDETAQIAHNVFTLEHVAPSRSNPEVTSMLDFVVARALKKDLAVRYQDGYELATDLRTCLAELRGRSEQAPKERASQSTRTVKLDPTQVVPIAADTRLAVSSLLDSSAGLQRLAKPGWRERAVLERAPRPVGLLRRLWYDPGPRLLAASALLAAAAGGYIALV
jgi:eukaryotic-like serine/threonine-protein kinase